MKKLNRSRIQELFAAIAAGQRLYIPADNKGQAQFLPWVEGLEMTGAPKVMLGTKWPSITSRWSISAPASSMARLSSPRREKSQERREGDILMGFISGTFLCVAAG